MHQKISIFFFQQQFTATQCGIRQQRASEAFYIYSSLQVRYWYLSSECTVTTVKIDLTRKPKILNQPYYLDRCLLRLPYRTYFRSDFDKRAVSALQRLQYFCIFTQIKSTLLGQMVLYLCSFVIPNEVAVYIYIVQVTTLIFFCYFY